MASTRSPERKLYQQVADQVRALIQTGLFSPGSRLPAERELAQQIGVSRPSLREALIALEIEGSVEIRMGSGIYVLAAAKQRHARPAPIGESPTELMQARAVVEGAIIVQATAQMTSETLNLLRQSLNGMRAVISENRKPLDYDRQFHLIIADQVGNNVLSRLVGELFDERHSPMSAGLRKRIESKETWELAFAEHEAIVMALEARDPLLAQALMHAHLEKSKRRWLENDLGVVAP